jgi:hypothetical protein
MIGYKSDQPESQTLPAGFEYLFAAQAKQVADNDNRGDFLAVIGDQPAHPAMAAMQTYGDANGLPVIVIELTAAQKKSPLLGDTLDAGFAVGVIRATVASAALTLGTAP